MKEALLNEAFIKEIALQVVQQQQPSVWYFYAVIIALNIIFGAIGVYLIKYAGKRGETAATKADFDEITRQLKETTRVSEQVRSEVSRADWVAREWKTIRRIKLEELVDSAMSVKAWSIDILSAYGDILHEEGFSDERKMENQRIRLSSSPAEKSFMICVLYFSDTKTQLTERCESLYRESFSMSHFISTASKETLEKNQYIPPEELGWNKQHVILLNTIEEIKTEAAKIMKEICG